VVTQTDRQLTAAQLVAGLVVGLATLAIAAFAHPLSLAASGFAIAAGLALAWLARQAADLRFIGFIAFVLGQIFVVRIFAGDYWILAQWLAMQTALACALLLLLRRKR
jgi:hypothetical protein